MSAKGRGGRKRVADALAAQPAWQVLAPPRAWMCPFCAQVGVEELPEGVDARADACLTHLEGGCPGWKNGEGAERAPADLKRAVSQRELRRRVKTDLVQNPAWQLIDSQRTWYCPFCGEGTPVVIPEDRRMTDEVLGGIAGHLDGCYAFRAQAPEKPLGQLKSIVKYANQSKRLAENVRKKLEGDPAWRRKDPRGRWICAYCLAVQEHIDLASQQAMFETAPRQIAKHLAAACAEFKAGGAPKPLDAPVTQSGGLLPMSSGAGGLSPIAAPPPTGLPGGRSSGKLPHLAESDAGPVAGPRMIGSTGGDGKESGREKKVQSDLWGRDAIVATDKGRKPVTLREMEQSGEMVLIDDPEMRRLGGAAAPKDRVAPPRDPAPNDRPPSGWGPVAGNLAQVAPVGQPKPQGKPSKPPEGGWAPPEQRRPAATRGREPASEVVHGWNDGGIDMARSDDATPPRGVAKDPTPARGVPRDPTPARGVPREPTPAQGNRREPEPRRPSGRVKAPSPGQSQGGQSPKAKRQSSDWRREIERELARVRSLAPGGSGEHLASGVGVEDDLATLARTLRFAERGLQVRQTILRSTPARGDFIDLVDLGGDQVGVIAGGVLGEEPEAPLLAAMARHHARSRLIRHADPRAALIEINREMFADLEGRTFVALLLATLDLPTMRLDMARAGLSAPILVNPARPEPLVVLHTDGMVIGIDKGPVFEPALTRRTFELVPGDLLALFTNGAVEARSHAREEFGLERMHALTRRYGTHELEYFTDKLRECFESFVPDPTHRVTDVVALGLSCNRASV